MNKKRSCISIVLLVAFAVWTWLVCFVDIKAIGPEESSVGLATLNGVVHSFTGVNMLLYTVTDWLGLVPVAVAFGFAAVGLVQWIKRGSLMRVDHSILALGVFYIAVMTAYIFFETVIINYRPILIDGCLEASYPSSTTLLVMCVMPTALMQVSKRVKVSAVRCGIMSVIIAFTVFMVVGRLISGVHWVSDIIGGVILSSGLVTMYAAFDK